MFFKTNDKSANFELIETYREGATTFGVISARNEVSVQAIEKEVEKLGYSVLGTCVRDGRPSVAIATDQAEKDVVNAISGGKPLEQVAVAKPVNMWFWRGLMGLTGQILNLSHSALTGDKNLFKFASWNIAANSMAMGFGAQKRNDDSTLKQLNNEFDHLTTEGGGRADISQQVEKAHEEQQKKHPEQMDEVTREKQGVMGFIRSNSVKIQHVLRLIAAGNVFNGGIKELKENKAAGIKKMPIRFVAGLLILPGKLIGMIAGDDNPDRLPQEKAGFWKNFVVHANQVGSLIELTGFTLLAFEGVSKNHTISAERAASMKPWALDVAKKLKVESGWMQAFGQSLFVASYMVQSVAPLSKKVFPMERALQSASWHLQTVDDSERSQTAVSMAHQMYRKVPSVRQEGLAKTLAKIYTTAHLPITPSAEQDPIAVKRALYASAGVNSALENSAVAEAVANPAMAAEASSDPTVRPLTTPATRALGEEAAQHAALDSTVAKHPASEVHAQAAAPVASSWQAKMQEKKLEEQQQFAHLK